MQHESSHPLPTAQCGHNVPLANCPCQHTDRDSTQPTPGCPSPPKLLPDFGDPPPRDSLAQMPAAASLSKAGPVCLRARPLCIMRIHRFCLRSFQKPLPSSILDRPAVSPGAASPSLEGAGHAPPPQALVTVLLDSWQPDSSSVRSAPLKKWEEQVVPEEPHWGGDGQGLSALRSPAPQSTAPSAKQDSARGERQREFQSHASARNYKDSLLHAHI